MITKEQAIELGKAHKALPRIYSRTFAGPGELVVARVNGSCKVKRGGAWELPIIIGVGSHCALPSEDAHEWLTERELKAPERIRVWVQRQFNLRYVDRVVADLIDVATGNRDGNSFEREALARIFPEWQRQTK